MGLDQAADVLSDELLDSFEASLGEVAEGEEGGRQISMKRHVFTIKTKDGRQVAHRVRYQSEINPPI